MRPKDGVSTSIREPADSSLGSDGLQRVTPTPTVVVSASELFCHPSRIANTYEPAVERVHQKEFVIPGEDVILAIKKGITLPYGRQAGLGWRRRLLSYLDIFHRGHFIDLKERLVYDARPIFNGNMAHLVQHHLANLGYLKDQLGYGPRDVLVILEGNPAILAVEVFSLLGYEVLATNMAVGGNLVEVSLDHFFHLLPYVRHLDMGAWNSDSPRRIFIPRKGSRRLINEKDIEAALGEHGFEKVYFEDISIREQWSLMRNATHIAAIHGAALGCLAFQAARTDGRRARLMELFGPGFVVNPFRKFMAVLGGKWVGCRGRITPAVARDIDVKGKAKAHAFDDFELAVETVVAGLEFMGKGEVT